MAKSQRLRIRRGTRRFLTGFAVMLVVSAIFQGATDEKTFRVAQAAQERWITVMSAFTPWNLVTGYWSDLKASFRGDFSWSPPQRSDEETIAGFELCKSESDRIYLAAACEAPTSLVTLDYCEKARKRLANPKLPWCEGEGPQGETATVEPEAVSPLLDDRPNAKGGGILAPFWALYRTWTRLTYDGGISYLYAFAQLGAGLLGVLLLTNLATNGRQTWPDHPVGWLILFPAGLIGCASVLAFIFKWLMIGALTMLSWLTDLAAISAGAAGFAGFCWWVIVKLAEYSTQEALTPKK